MLPSKKYSEEVYLFGWSVAQKGDEGTNPSYTSRW